MSIRIVDSPEPLSTASWTAECVLADSEASLLLSRELQLYCDRWSTGRSFLVAGHRGSGKTTLVLNSFLKVWKNDRYGTAWLRPLLVQLHGPSLLTPPEEISRPAASRPREASATGVEGAPSKEERPKSESQLALEQITLCVYQSLAREISFQFRRRILDEPVTFARRERLELAAQLESELYECPEAARLRDFWARGGFLERGVLFPPGTHRHPDQGFRELVALSGACEAYRRIAGTLTQKDIQSVSGKAKEEASASLDTTGKDLLGPLTALLTGGLVGVGAFVANSGDAAVAALTGVVAALGASLVLKHSWSRSRERSGARESTFLFDTSVPTLERVLPSLIERFRGAGLAPIFVVDELDKIPDLSVRMGRMVPQLKKFVSENAFFCFLTDRGYFESWKQRGDDAAYPVEYTYFTHQLYVLFSSQGLHEYLNKVLVVPEESEDLADYPLLPYVLLHRSRMHPIDLRRELALMRDSNNTIKLPRGRVRSAPAFRVDLILQIAIEMVLADKDLAEQIECHPTFRRLAHDALYYLSRKWQKEEDLDLSDSGEFHRYLRDRMGKEAVGKGIQLPENDVTFLFSKVRRLAELVSDLRRSYPAALAHWKDRIKETQPLPGAVESALGLDFEPTPVLEQVPGEKWLFRWCVDASGMPPEGSPELETLNLSHGPDVWENVEFIEELCQTLTSFGGPKGPWVDLTLLASGLRILNTSPAWPEAERAIARLKNARQERRHHTDFMVDVACVRAFADMLRRSGSPLRDALFTGAVVGRASDGRNPGERLLRGLDAVSRLYRFPDLQEKEVAECLETLARTLESELDLPSLSPAPPLNDRESLEAWAGAVRHAMSLAEKVDLLKARPLNERRAASWAAWSSRLLNAPPVPGSSAPRPISNPTLDDLICAAARVSPASLLQPNVGEMGLAAWSEVLLWALADAAPETPCYTPVWAAIPALLALGFSPGSLSPLIQALREGKVSYSRRLFLQEEVALLTPWDVRMMRSLEESKPSLLILRRSTGSAVEAWKSSPQGAAIVLTAEGATRLGNSWPPPFATLEAFVAIDWIAVEEMGSADAAAVLQRAIERSTRKRGARVLKAPLLFQTEPPTDGSTPKNLARNLEELLARYLADAAPVP